MKLISRNVNGIRAGINKGTFFEYLKTNNPDIIGLQEVKAKIEQLDESHINEIKNLGYEIYWNSAVRPGYSGTAILTKIKPINIYYGIDTTGLQLDKIETDEVIEENHEGRVITAEFENFYFITVYTPNSKRDLERLEYRQIWDHVFLKYMKFLETKKPVIFCGDLNVAHREIDLANPSTNKTTKTKPGNAGFTDKERFGIQEFINAGFIDTFRYFFPEKSGAYSWWSNFAGARAKNIGWRIDYFLVSNNLKDKLKNAFITPEVMGSDHCPVGIDI
ncbi:MAG: exodeoxyribonuclease III [Candidatus Gracilibacteria bacterium]|nr:exodeoxyribonuclease III [Candidatus Gracilibacteria bacterium]